MFLNVYRNQYLFIGDNEDLLTMISKDSEYKKVLVLDPFSELGKVQSFDIVTVKSVMRRAYASVYERNWHYSVLYDLGFRSMDTFLTEFRRVPSSVKVVLKVPKEEFIKNSLLVDLTALRDASIREIYE